MYEGVTEVWEDEAKNGLARMRKVLTQATNTSLDKCRICRDTEWISNILQMKRRIVESTKGDVGENSVEVSSNFPEIRSGNYSIQKLEYSDLLLKLFGISERTKIISTKEFKLQNLTNRSFLHSYFIDEDIRTPLSMVLGYASELEDDALLPQEARKQAGIIRRESEKMKRLIDDLNLTTKLEYALQPVHRKEVDWVELNRQTISEFLNNGLDGRYEITFTETQPGRAIHFMGDAGLLQRMLENLIRNCITHNPQGCTITLSVGEENGCALCVISDDGVGIAPDRLEALNGGDAIDSSQSGDEKAEHGLGLKLVAQIVRAHQGTISFASSIPHGLTVKIVLPLLSPLL